MARKYRSDKMPMENRVDARYPSSAHNNRYMNVKGKDKSCMGCMGHASNVMQVNPCPNYDINRVNYSDYQNKNTPMQAFDYEY